MEGTEFARLTGDYSNAVIGTWELLFQDRTSNISVIKLRAYYYYGGGTQTSGSGQHNITLDGTNIKSDSSYSYKPGTWIIGVKTIEVEHNPNGTFPGREVTIEIKGWFNPLGTTTGRITNIPTIK